MAIQADRQPTLHIGNSTKDASVGAAGGERDSRHLRHTAELRIDTALTSAKRVAKQTKKEKPTMKRMYDIQEIAQLIDKFMAGETSIAEEDVLAQYFRTHEVSEEWAVYKEMFALFDNGEVDIEVKPTKQEDEAHAIKVEMPTTTKRKRTRMVALRWTTAVAASFLLLLMLHNTNANSNTEAVDRMVMVQQQRMLDEADRSFQHTTIRCAMDIDETFSLSEAQEEADFQTNIYI